MNTWYDYRAVWSEHPWVAVLAVVAVLALLGGIVGTVLADLLALLFIPGLGAVYVHHLIVQRLLE